MLKQDRTENGSSAHGSCGHALFSEQEWQVLAQSMRLSARELQIVQAFFNDEVEIGIAQRLSLSPHTVHTYIDRLYRKLGVRSRCGVFTKVFRHFRASLCDPLLSTGSSSGCDHVT